MFSCNLYNMKLYNNSIEDYLIYRLKFKFEPGASYI